MTQTITTRRKYSELKFIVGASHCITDSEIGLQTNEFDFYLVTYTYGLWLQQRWANITFDCPEKFHEGELLCMIPQRPNRL